MHIGLSLFHYFPYGGLQQNFLAVARELLQRGHQVTVFTGAWQGDSLPGLEVKLLNSGGWTNAARNRRYAGALHKALSEARVDLVVGFNKIPGLDVYYCADTCFARKAYEERGPLYRMTGRVRQSLNYEAAVFGQEQRTEILLLAEKEGEAFKRYYGTRDSRLHLVPPGIKRDRVRHEGSDELRRIARQALDIDGHEPVLMFLGAYFRTKGLDRVLQALAKLPAPGPRLLVVGNDKRRQDYEQLADKLGVLQRCHFLGQRDDVPALLFAADALVHPARLENTGNVLLEAAVAGLPVICSGTCGYATYIRDYKLGWVLPEPFRQEDLDNSLVSLLESDADWQARGAGFAGEADLFSRHQRIAELIESTGQSMEASHANAD